MQVPTIGVVVWACALGEVDGRFDHEERRVIRGSDQPEGDSGADGDLSSGSDHDHG